MTKFIGTPSIEGIVALYRALIGRDMPPKQVERLKQRSKRKGEIPPASSPAGGATSASGTILEAASDPDGN